MNRVEIYAALDEERFIIQRRECTPRVMAVCDGLLDRLNALNEREALDQLLLLKPVEE